MEGKQRAVYVLSSVQVTWYTLAVTLTSQTGGGYKPPEDKTLTSQGSATSKCMSGTLGSHGGATYRAMGVAHLSHAP